VCDAIAGALSRTATALIPATTLALAALIHRAAGQTPPALAAEELFRSAQLEGASLSPDGKHLGAIVTDDKDVKNLMIYDLQGQKPLGLRGHWEYEIASFAWLNDRRVVFSVLKDKIYTYGLYAADLEHLGRVGSIDTLDATQVIGIPRDRPGSVIVWVRAAARDEGRPGGLFELDASREGDNAQAPWGGDWKALVRRFVPPKLGTVTEWKADHRGDLGLCFTWLDGKFHLFRREAATNGWREIPMRAEVRVMDFDTDPNFIWVVAHSEATGFALRRLDIASGRAEKAVLTDSTYDISRGRLHFSDRHHGLAGVTYLQRKPVSVWFDQEYAAAQATVDQQEPETDGVLVSQDRSERKLLYVRVGPRHPPSYELLDLDAHTLRQVAAAAPWLKDRPMRPVTPITFRTRDGLRLEGYLTMPAGADPGHPVPMVVLCHGGPWVRDTPDFNPEVQFLASRGYAVLQPNYRGSSGYLPKISERDAYNFRRMVDDVADATRDVLTLGTIDPRRVAIMGGSFGGYLAAAGVAFEPGLFRCAVTECGVFDWERFVASKRDVARPGEYERLTDMLGTSAEARRHLEDISPLEHADQIRVPVLIAHGTEDKVVDVAQSKKLAAALKKRGVPCETFFRPLEAHGFYDLRDRVAFYHRVEAFLAANVGGATLTPGR
jgi:dipeptidyl aminopeptidase/acylaminoacyl peptidase